MLDLVDRRFDALLAGEKTDTVRLDEGHVEPGLLAYRSFPSGNRYAVVLVTNVSWIRLREVSGRTTDTRHRDPRALLESMRLHYPQIELDTVVMYVEHLSPDETFRRRPAQVEQTLSELQAGGS